MTHFRQSTRSQLPAYQYAYGNKTVSGVCMQSTSDYSPFGVLLDGRSMQKMGYRYGYQGSEKDDEIRGEGNSYTTFFRKLDPRLSRWLSLDPKVVPWASPYVCMGNNPIVNNDLLGDTIRFDGSAGGDIIKNVLALKESSKLFATIFNILDASPVIYHVMDGSDCIREKGSNANGMFNYKPDSEDYQEIFLRPSNSEKTLTEEFFHAIQILEYYGFVAKGKVPDGQERYIQEIEAEANLMQILVLAEIRKPNSSMDASILMDDQMFFDLLTKNEFSITEYSTNDLVTFWSNYLNYYENSSSGADGFDAYRGCQRLLYPELVNLIVEISEVTSEKPLTAPPPIFELIQDKN